MLIVADSTEADEEMLPELMRLVRQLISDGDLMLARTMRKTAMEKCEYFRDKHESTQQVTLLSSYELTTKYVYRALGLSCCLVHVATSSRILFILPCAGSGVVRIDPLRFLAGCRTGPLNQV